MEMFAVRPGGGFQTEISRCSMPRTCFSMYTGNYEEGGRKEKEKRLVTL